MKLRIQVIISASSQPESVMIEPRDKDFSRLMASLGGIRKLKHDRVDLLQQRPKQRRAGQQKPLDTGGHALASTSMRHIPDSTCESWFHHGLQRKLQRNIRMGKLEIESILDLHGYRRHEALQQLDHFLQDALDMQARMLLIIHGKGYNSQTESVLRPLVQHWLSEQSSVLAWCPAQARDGGHGASYVYCNYSANR